MPSGHTLEKRTQGVGRWAIRNCWPTFWNSMTCPTTSQGALAPSHGSFWRLGERFRFCSERLGTTSTEVFFAKSIDGRMKGLAIGLAGLATAGKQESIRLFINLKFYGKKITLTRSSTCSSGLEPDPLEGPRLEPGGRLSAF